MISRDHLTAWVRGTGLALVYASALTVAPLLIATLSQWVTIPHVDWFHYTPNDDAPPFAQQFHDWLINTYDTIRIDLDDRARAGLVIILVLGGSWLGLVWITLSTLWCLARNGVDALRERAASWGPRGWIASLLTTLVLSGAASPAYAATGTTRAAATAPQHPHHDQPHGHGPTAEHPRTPGEHTHPPPRQPDVHLPADIRPDCARYRVHRGDTLSRIAERELGTIARWHDLARVNAFQLGRNPDHLEPGWEILLPPEAAPPKQNPTKVITVTRGDTLWSISERELGTPNRWGELWDLNLRRPQPDGLQLSLPDRLQPGWHIVVPDEPHNKPAPGFTPTAPVPSRDPFTIDPWPDPRPPTTSQQRPIEPTPGPPTPSLEPPPSKTQQPQPTPLPENTTPVAPKPHPHRHDAVGISTTSGAYVSLGLAALATLATITVRLHRRRTYQPGSPEAPDPSTTPIVHALRLSHETNTSPNDQEDAPTEWAPLPDLGVRNRAHATTNAVLPEPDQTLLGQHDGQHLALNLAATLGLGLTGPAAIPAARALLLTLLGHDPAKAHQILISQDDARRLFNTDLAHGVPPCLHLVEDFSTALDTLEITAQDADRVTLVATTPAPDLQARLETLLTQLAGVHAILLGAWEYGDTLHVRDDGTVSTAASATGTHLTGARLFHLPRHDATQLLDLLATAHHVQLPDQHAHTESTPVPSDHQDAHEFILDDNTAAEIATEPEHLTLQPPPTDTPSASTHDNTAQRQPDEAHDPELPGTQAAHAHDDHGSHTSRTAGSAPLHLQVLGRLHLTLTGTEPRELIDDISPRQREILIYLALHPSGVRRDTLTADLWPDNTKATNSFHATLSQLRTTLKNATHGTVTTITLNEDGHYRLNPTLVTIDLWNLRDALTTRTHSGTHTESITALQHVAELYHGDLANNLTTHGWLDPPREALRRDVLDALSDLTRLLGDNDAHQRRHILEQARQLDPYNEPLYRDLMRTHAQLGHHDAIPRTLNLLAHTLAELDQQPTHDTQQLAHTLTHSDTRTPE